MIVYLILKFDLGVGISDVKVAFLESFMQESDAVYVHLPEGYKVAGKCALLICSLYGCKQSGRNFFKLMRAMFKELSYQQHPYSPCIYMDLAEDPEDFVLVAVQVDDILYAGKGPKRAALEQELTAHFRNIKFQPGMQQFMGVNFEFDGAAQTVKLHQKKQIEHIAKRFESIINPKYRLLTPLDVAADRFEPSMVLTDPAER